MDRDLAGRLRFWSKALPASSPCTVTSSLVMNGADATDLAKRDVRVVSDAQGVQVVELLDASGRSIGHFPGGGQ